MGFTKAGSRNSYHQLWLVWLIPFLKVVSRDSTGKVNGCQFIQDRNYAESFMLFNTAILEGEYW